MAGIAGEGFALLILKDGILTGVDTGRVIFDGTFENSNEGSIFGTVTVKAPPHITLIQGVTADANGLTYSANFSVPADFATKPYLRFETPIGPINGTLELLRRF